MLTTPASLSVDGLQRIGDIALTPDLYILFVHQFEDGILLTVSSGFLAFYLILWLVLQQTVVPCLTLLL